MTDQWTYRVYFGISPDALLDAIESKSPLYPKAVANIDRGQLAAVAYRLGDSERAHDVLLNTCRGLEVECGGEDDAPRIAGPSPVDLDTRVVWAFPGQGAQKVGLLQGLYKRSAVFRDSLKRHLDAASSAVGVNFLDALYPDEGSTEQTEARLTDTAYCQPVMVGVTLALAAWFSEAGLRMDGAMGHSLGEFAAVSALGGVESEGLMRFVALRGQIMVDALEGEDMGAMAAVMAPEPAVREALSTHPDVVIANINQPKQTVISGPTASVEAAVKSLRRARLPGKKLSVSHAFHSPLMQKPARKLLSEIEKLTFSDLTRPLHSAILVESINKAEVLEEMFRCHAESPVRYLDTLKALGNSEVPQLFVEMGPGKTLTSFARYTLGEEGCALESSAISPDGEAALAEALVGLVSYGIPVGSGLLDS